MSRHTTKNKNGAPKILNRQSPKSVKSAVYFRRISSTRWLHTLFAVLMMVVLAAGCAGSQAQPPAENEVVTAFIGDLTAEATASGAVLPRRQATLSVNTPGLVETVTVRVGDVVAPGQALVQLDAGDLALNVTHAEQTVRLAEAGLASLLEPPDETDVAAAEAAVASAQANLDDLLAGPSAQEIAISEAAVRASQASVASASADLSGAQDSIQESQIVAAQAELLAAQVNRDRIQEENEAGPNAANHQALLDAEQVLADAQAQLETLLAGPEVGAAQSTVAAANARLQGSQAELDQLLAGVAAAEAAGAEVQLAQAQAELAALIDGAPAAEIAAAEAEVEQARLSLAGAEAELAAATIRAPFAGVVTAVAVSEGEVASGAAVTLVDMDSLEVVLAVDEIDVGNLAAGQPALITLETWPDVAIDSEITAIAPGATTAPDSALVTYDVHLSLAQTDLPVRAGMTANANLITAQRENVLLVPNRAVNVDRQSGTYSVNLVAGDGTQEVPVTIGLRDSQHTQILDGLQAGDSLLITNSAPIEDLMQGP